MLLNNNITKKTSSIEYSSEIPVMCCILNGKPKNRQKASGRQGGPVQLSLCLPACPLPCSTAP